jgi:hypothetical protein
MTGDETLDALARGAIALRRTTGCTDSQRDFAAGMLFACIEAKAAQLGEKPVAGWLVERFEDATR